CGVVHIDRATGPPYRGTWQLPSSVLSVADVGCDPYPAAWPPHDPIRMKQPQRAQQAAPLHGAAPVPDQPSVLDTVIGSDAFLRMVWDSAPDAMVLSDGDCVVLMANAAYCRLYGYEVRSEEHTS